MSDNDIDEILQAYNGLCSLAIIELSSHFKDTIENRCKFFGIQYGDRECMVELVKTERDTIPDYPNIGDFYEKRS